MFAIGSAQPQPYTRDILREIGKVLNDVPNRITLVRPHRRHAVLRRRARLQQLGAVGRPRQRVAPRAAGRRHATTRASRVWWGCPRRCCWTPAIPSTR